MDAQMREVSEYRRTLYSMADKKMSEWMAPKKPKKSAKKKKKRPDGKKQAGAAPGKTAVTETRAQETAREVREEKPEEAAGRMQEEQRPGIRSEGNWTVRKTEDPGRILARISGSRQPGTAVRRPGLSASAVNLQEAVAWAEILGEPVSKRRKRQRRSMQNMGKGESAVWQSR